MIPGSGRSPREEDGNTPIFLPGNSKVRGALWAAVYGAIVTEIKTQINKWDLIKLKSICITREAVKQTNKKDNPQSGRKCDQ